MSSVAFDKIVPFGQDFVLDDIPLTLTLKERVAFFLCLIYAGITGTGDSKVWFLKQYLSLCHFQCIFIIFNVPFFSYFR